MPQVRVKNPLQDVTFNIPDEGQVFRAPGGQNEIFRWSGGNFERFDDQSVRELNKVPETEKVDFGGFLKQQGLDLGSLPEFNLGDITSGFQSAYGKSPMTTRQSDVKRFFPGDVKKDTSTTLVTPQNPNEFKVNGVDVTQENFLSGGKVKGMESTQPQQQPQQSQSTYSGPSIVDYLNSVGQASDFNSRSALAQRMGIQGYKGTAEQNTQLLNTLRQSQGQTPQQGGQAPGQESPMATATPQNSFDAAQGMDTKGLITQYGSEELSVTDFLSQIKTSLGLDESTKEIEKLDNMMIDEMQEVNDNPWYSEAQRSQKTKSVQERFEGKRQALVDRLKLKENAVGLALTAFEKERELKKDIFIAQMNLKEKQIDNARLQAKLDFDQRLADERMALNEANINSLIADRNRPGKDGLTEYQEVQTFNNIVNKYNSSPLIQASDRTNVLKNTIAQVKQNPTNGATQLSLIYGWIQALDNYQSAVREGEISLSQNIQSKIGKMENYFQQINSGQILTKAAALDMASSAQNLVDSITQGASQKAKSFQAQSDVAGVGDQWGKYISGAQPSYQASQVDLSDLDFKF